MRVDAAAIVAIDATAADLHALLLDAGCSLNPMAKGWFPARNVLRARVVWRNRARRSSFSLVVTLDAARLGEALI